MNNDHSIGKVYIFGLSFITAIAFWFYVLNNEPLTVERVIAVDYINPAGLAPVSSIPRQVTVKIKGSRAFVKNLFFEKDKVYVDLKKFNYKKDTFVVNFTADMIPIPFGVEVLEISPSQTLITLDKEIKKYVPVRPELVGKVGAGLNLINKEVIPAEFMIKGPRTLLKNIGQLRTLPFDVSKLSGESGNIKLSLEKIDPLVEIIDQKDVFFNYELKANKANYTLKKIPIKFLTIRSKFFSKIKHVAMDVLVSDEELFKKIKVSNLKVIAEIPDRRGPTKVKLRAELPEGIHLLKLYPETIIVNIN